MSKLKFSHRAWLIAQTSCSIVLALLMMTSSTLALSQSNLEFFAANGIYYYNPSGANVSCLSGSMMNYAGAQIFSSAQQEALSANQPFYEAASSLVASEYGYTLPWQIIATLHYKEHGLQRDNPSNGQGAYQLYSYTGGGNNSNAFYPTGPLSDQEFQSQTDLVARLIAQPGGYGEGLDLTDPNDVKRLFFKYNGAARQYYDRAIAMGFSEEEAKNGEGSTYVMNRYDASRDPANKAAMSPLWEGRFTGDGVWDPNSVSDQTFGAFTVYEALGGSGFCGGGLVSGGMTYEEAYAFVENYVNNPSECTEWSTICGIGIETGANCVTFSQYFLSKYTTLGAVSPMGNGGDVVNNLINSHGLTDGGTIPRPYAIFSTRSSRWASTVCDDGRLCGHTGVVLGIDEEKDEIYFGQMAYGSARTWGLTRIKYKLSDYTDGEFYYAYTDNFLK